MYRFVQARASSIEITNKQLVYFNCIKTNSEIIYRTIYSPEKENGNTFYGKKKKILEVVVVPIGGCWPGGGRTEMRNCSGNRYLYSNSN